MIKTVNTTYSLDVKVPFMMPGNGLILMPNTGESNSSFDFELLYKDTNILDNNLKKITIRTWYWKQIGETNQNIHWCYYEM